MMKSLYVLTPEEKTVMDEVVTQPAVLLCTPFDLVALNLAHAVATEIVKDLLKDCPAELRPLFFDLLLCEGEGAIIVDDECSLGHNVEPPLPQ